MANHVDPQIKVAIANSAVGPIVVARVSAVTRSIIVEARSMGTMLDRGPLRRQEHARLAFAEL